MNDPASPVVVQPLQYATLDQHAALLASAARRGVFVLAIGMMVAAFGVLLTDIGTTLGMRGTARVSSPFQMVSTRGIVAMANATLLIVALAMLGTRSAFAPWCIRIAAIFNAFGSFVSIAIYLWSYGLGMQPVQFMGWVTSALGTTVAAIGLCVLCSGKVLFAGRP